MTHLKAISLPRLASDIPPREPAGDSVTGILDTVFAFVLELVNVKGKGTSA